MGGGVCPLEPSSTSWLNLCNGEYVDAGGPQSPEESPRHAGGVAHTVTHCRHDAARAVVGTDGIYNYVYGYIYS